MPVARLVGARERTTAYGLAAVDGAGRLADRTVTNALGWQPGDPLNIRVTNGLIIVAAATDGPVAVSNQGRVHLPAAARHACRITAGDRVLLAAGPADGLRLGHPPANRDAIARGS